MKPPLQVKNLQRRRYHSTMEVEIDNCETVGDLKKAIAVQQNLSVIALLFRGLPLDDARQLEKLLPDLRVGAPRFAVHTRVRPRTIQGGVTINVLTLKRKTFQVSLPSLDSTLAELKELIKGYEGISMHQIALTYQGKQITHEDHATLRDCRFEPGCTVHLVGRLRGGVKGSMHVPCEPVLFVDMEETSLLQRIRLQPKRAPEWRVSEEGLSVEGECWNERCAAYKQMVICNLNFAVFNLKEDVHCPLCKVGIRPLTCGFRKCLWMFEGRKMGPGKVDVASQWMQAGNDYERFDEGAERSTSSWSSLIITARKLPSCRSLKDFHGDGDCSICTEDFTAASAASVCTIKCNHTFHRECILFWQMRGHSTCPMCRSPIE